MDCQKEKPFSGKLLDLNLEEEMASQQFEHVKHTRSISFRHRRKMMNKKLKLYNSLSQHGIPITY